MKTTNVKISKSAFEILEKEAHRLNISIPQLLKNEGCNTLKKITKTPPSVTHSNCVKTTVPFFNGVTHSPHVNIRTTEIKPDGTITITETVEVA